MGSFLEEGDVIELDGSHTVTATIPNHFFSLENVGDFSVTTNDVSLGGAASWLQGLYVVTKTELTGGSTGRDPFPNGHKVTCERVDSGHIVSFYQSGDFRNMIKDIKPIGRAKRVWDIDNTL